MRTILPANFLPSYLLGSDFPQLLPLSFVLAGWGMIVLGDVAHWFYIP